MFVYTQPTSIHWQLRAEWVKTCRRWANSPSDHGLVKAKCPSPCSVCFRTRRINGPSSFASHRRGGTLGSCQPMRSLIASPAFQVLTFAHVLTRCLFEAVEVGDPSSALWMKACLFPIRRRGWLSFRDLRGEHWVELSGGQRVLFL